MTVTVKDRVYTSEVDGIPSIVYDENNNTLTIGNHTFENGYMLLHHINYVRTTTICNRVGVLS
jgi:hypothetical protein